MQFSCATSFPRHMRNMYVCRSGIWLCQSKQLFYVRLTYVILDLGTWKVSLVVTFYSERARAHSVCETFNEVWFYSEQHLRACSWSLFGEG